MQARDPFLYDLSNSHCLADSLSHSLQHNFFHPFFLKEGGGVGDVVADEALCGDTDLVLTDGGGLGPRLLDPLVPIHGGRRVGGAAAAAFDVLLLNGKGLGMGRGSGVLAVRKTLEIVGEVGVRV